MTPSVGFVARYTGELVHIHIRVIEQTFGSTRTYRWGPFDTCWATETKIWGKTCFQTPKVCSITLMCSWTNSPIYLVTKPTLGSIMTDSWVLVRKHGLPEPKLGSNSSRWHSSLIYAFWILNTKVWCSTSEFGEKSEHLCTKYRFPSLTFLTV